MGETVTRRFTVLLAATAIAVYTLVLTGATASLAEAGAACSTWPTCDGSWIVPLDETGLLIAMGHRLASLVTGLVLLAVTAIAWRIDVPRVVRWILTAALALYPVQVGIGALTAVTGGSSTLSSVHLLIAMGIFSTVLLALLYWLEWETRHVDATFDAGASERPPAGPGARESAHHAGAADPPGPLGHARAYLSLTKPRLMWLLCAVALAGMGLATAATGIALTWAVVIGTLLGGVLAIGASGTFNHVLERDVDRQMARTADRPVVTEQVPARRATAFGLGLAIASMGVFLWLVNPLAAGLGLVAIGFYSVVYTIILKPHTTQNIVIGGAVGALPALIGWAAVTGSIGLPAVVLGLVVFLWTPAHFYNLALVYRADYERGGFPMLPVVRGERVTLRHIGYYLGATLVGVGLLGVTASLGWLYATTAIVFAAVFLWAIVRLYRERTPTSAMRTFHTSNLFLGVLMLVIVLETAVTGWL